MNVIASRLPGFFCPALQGSLYMLNTSGSSGGRIVRALSALAAIAFPVVAAGEALAATPLQKVGTPTCFTWAPEDWHMIDQNPRGPILTLGSSDGLLAGYAGVAVNGGQARGMYGPQFRTPEVLIAYMMSGSVGEQMREVGAAQQWGYYQAVRYASPRHIAYALYYRFPVPDPAGYGLLARMAIGHAGDLHSLGVAGAVATATLCQGTMQPPAGGYQQYEPPKTPARAIGSARNSDVQMGGTYNAQLNTGWAHDGNGSNYHIDVARDWHDNGPQGPGFYAPSKFGGKMIKVDPGLQ